jgi:hypothetical protein
MAVPKGVRIGGRQKGTPNKATQSAREICRRLKCDPIEGLAHIAKDVKVPIEVRQRAYSDLARYTYPRLNAIEHTGDGGGPLQVEVNVRDEFTRRIIGLASRARTSGTDRQPE